MKEDVVVFMKGLTARMDLRYTFSSLKNLAYLFRIYDWSYINYLHMLIVISLFCWLGGCEMFKEDAKHAVYQSGE